MCSAEMETELGKEVGCSMCDAPSMTEGGHGQAQILIPAPGSLHIEPAATSFPTLMPALVPPPPPPPPPHHHHHQPFSYSDLQLVVAPSQTKAVVTNGNSGDGDGDGDGEDEKKREREHLHKKRSKNWTRVETLKLIKMRTELDPKFARSGRKSELWDEIAEALQKGQFARDAQQCRDKWEKLMAGYKDVREGFKDREDNPYYDELHPLLSGKSLRKEKEREKDVCKKDFDHREPVILNANHEEIEGNLSRFNNLDEEGDELLDVSCLRKRKRCSKYVSAADIGTVKALLETVIAQQQKFFKELLESVERSEQAREQIRQEREEKWRAEERAHRSILNNAMIVLTQKLLGERGMPSAAVAPATSDRQCQGPKKRSKNWKRGEVLHLIKLRGEMEGRFANSTRRAVLWEELAEALDTQGIKRDGKQCREKWDKLMAAYKDVIDGKREEGDLPYFSELKAIVGGKPDEGYRFHTESDEYKENVASIHLMPETISERPPPST